MSDKKIFDRLREMSGGKLTQEQVDGINAVIAAGHREDIRKAFSITDDVYMNVSLEGMQLIAGFEGYRSTAYLDSAGIWTIGFGTIKYPNGVRVKKGDTCTREQALMWKKHDIAYFEKKVNDIITVPLKQGQFDALVSFVYNIGETAFANGRVDDFINAGKTEEALKVWASYNKARVRGVLTPIAGLTNRRNAEIAYFRKA